MTSFRSVQLQFSAPTAPLDFYPKTALFIGDGYGIQKRALPGATTSFLTRPIGNLLITNFWPFFYTGTLLLLTILPSYSLFLFYIPLYGILNLGIPGTFLGSWSPLIFGDMAYFRLFLLSAEWSLMATCPPMLPSLFITWFLADCIVYFKFLFCSKYN